MGWALVHETGVFRKRGGFPWCMSVHQGKGHMETGAEEVRRQAKDIKDCPKPLGEPQRTSPETLDPGSCLLQ